jgi:hypothetical protein
MANSFVRYTGDGNTTQFSITFDYIETAHVACTVDGVSTTFTLSSGGTVATLSSAPALGASVEFRRTTSQSARLTDYQAGSVLKESDLDTDSQQAFFMGQEAIDNAGDAIQISNTNFQWDALNKRITNVADPTSAQDVATKNYLENTWLSATDKATLNNVNSNIAAINTVNSNISDIQQTNSNATNINTVATNITSVNTVATDISKVIAVANDLAEAVSEVETVADDLNEATSEIDTVANSITNVDTVGNNIANVNTLAGISADVTTVAGISSNVTSVANNETNINAVNSNSSNINTVAGAVTNVNNVGNDITNVNTVATNLTDINSFENTYKISATAPTGVPEGTLWFDTANDIMKVYDGSAFANAGSSVNGTSQRNKFTATANQTVFSGNDDDSVALAYDPNFLDVYLNGVRLVNGASNDYTATDGSTITLTSGASAGDILNVVSFGTFQIASFSATAITSDTLPVARGGTGLSSLGSAGQALVVNSGGTALEFANASSAEVYGFNKNSSGELIVTTTNQGVDNISATDYANFDDKMFSASGFTFSLSNGELIATI